MTNDVKPGAVEKMIVDAYRRGAQWGSKHLKETAEYLDKAAYDYADAALTAWNARATAQSAGGGEISLHVEAGQLLCDRVQAAVSEYENARALLSSDTGGDGAIDLVAHLTEQSAWSLETFGPGQRINCLIGALLSVISGLIGFVLGRNL